MRNKGLGFPVPPSSCYYCSCLHFSVLKTQTYRKVQTTIMSTHLNWLAKLWLIFSPICFISLSLIWTNTEPSEVKLQTHVWLNISCVFFKTRWYLSNDDRINTWYDSVKLIAYYRKEFFLNRTFGIGRLLEASMS